MSVIKLQQNVVPNNRYLDSLNVLKYLRKSLCLHHFTFSKVGQLKLCSNPQNLSSKDTDCARLNLCLKCENSWENERFYCRFWPQTPAVQCSNMQGFKFDQRPSRTWTTDLEMIVRHHMWYFYLSERWDEALGWFWMLNHLLSSRLLLPVSSALLTWTTWTKPVQTSCKTVCVCWWAWWHCGGGGGGLSAGGRLPHKAGKRERCH